MPTATAPQEPVPTRMANAVPTVTALQVAFSNLSIRWCRRKLENDSTVLFTEMSLELFSYPIVTVVHNSLSTTDGVEFSKLASPYHTGFECQLS